METLKDADAGNRKGDLQIEIEIEGFAEPRDLHAPDGAVAGIRGLAQIEDDLHLFERDGDDPLVDDIKGRKAIRLVAHRARQIEVEVRYEHREKKRAFAPAKTVFRVLQWAVGKHGFDLDATAAARANLILPGADTPLPRDAVIGSFTKPGERKLVLDLTLRDFTNG
jgi:DNA-directed RNA polymerase subunit K/omega